MQSWTWNKTRWILALTALLSFLPIHGFEVESAFWCQDVEGRQPTEQTVLNSYRPQPIAQLKALVLWTKLVGTEADIESMKLQHKLPIRHVWKLEQKATLYTFLNVPQGNQSGLVPTPATNPLSEQALLHASINLDLGSPETFDLLQQYVKWNHSFFWRTWSDVTALYPGKWQVTVEYADGSPVYYKGQKAMYQIILQ